MSNLTRRRISRSPVRVAGGRQPAHQLAALVAVWLVTRLLVVVGGRARDVYPFQDDPFEVSVFARWGEALSGADGLTAPLREGPWEYPIGAVPVVLAPALLDGAPYVLGFVAQMVLWDAALLVLLALLGLRRGSLAGAWLWVAAIPFLGPVALTRFDVVPTALAVAGLASPPLLAGVLLTAGGAVKLWPALLLPLVLALRPGRMRVLVGAAAVTVATVAAAAVSGALPRLLSFLAYQRDRGLEVESVPALPLMIAHANGDERVEVGFAFGSYQVSGPGAAVLQGAGTAGLIGVVALTAWLAFRVRDRDAVVPLAVVLMSGVLLFNKVLSAQYPLWLAGLVALALCSPGSRLRVAVPPLLGALLLTQLVYPLAIQDLLAGHLAPVLLLAVRDLLIAVVAVVALLAAWRAPGSSRPRGETPPPDTSR